MNIKDVESLAELARIDLTEKEKESLLHDFASILAYVDTIKSVEVKDVKESHDLYNAWREDVEDHKDFSRDLILEQFPESQDGFLKVKKIL
jgi:aspartyl-tRNA(Asn)/glutamyl-tRNA(Gln) amidotransferase subunit C